MDTKKERLLADWPKVIHLDEKWAVWIGAVQQRIERLETVARGNAQRIEALETHCNLRPSHGGVAEAERLGTAAECWKRLDELAESASADRRRRNDEARLDDTKALLAISQRETIAALDLHHATREQLRTVQAELAAVLKLCGELVEQPPFGSVRR
jgi:multidrug resistance efflux pump